MKYNKNQKIKCKEKISVVTINWVKFFNNFNHNKIVPGMCRVLPWFYSKILGFDEQDECNEESKEVCVD